MPVGFEEWTTRNAKIWEALRLLSILNLYIQRKPQEMDYDSFSRQLWLSACDLTIEKLTLLEVEITCLSPPQCLQAPKVHLPFPLPALSQRSLLVRDLAHLAQPTPRRRQIILQL